MPHVNVEQLMPILKRHILKVCLVDSELNETQSIDDAFAIRFGGTSCRLYSDADYVVLE